MESMESDIVQSSPILNGFTEIRPIPSYKI